MKNKKNRIVSTPSDFSLKIYAPFRHCHYEPMEPCEQNILNTA